MALLHVDFFSKALRMATQMDVILPQNTTGQIGLEGKGGTDCPVLTLLHGLSDDCTIWQRRTSIERYVSNLGMAVVMPCGGRNWYTDSEDQAYYTFIAKELPELLKEFFPQLSTKREKNYIAGLSMGGYGAFKIAMKNPAQYSMAASLSGVMSIMDHFGKRREFDHIFADKTPEEIDIFTISEILAGSGAEKPKLFMWCGTEDSLIGANRRMHEHLDLLGYDVAYSESTGIHSWDYWDVQIQNVLKWISDRNH